MDEASWLVSTDPVAMLEWVVAQPADRSTRWVNAPVNYVASDRKLRLFACACCRQVWDVAVCPECDPQCPGYLKPDPVRDGKGVIRGPRCGHCHGSGRVGGLTDPRSRRAVEVAERYADGEATKRELNDAVENIWGKVWNEIDDSPDALAWHSAYLICQDIPLNRGEYLFARADALGCSHATQASLLRCLFGNPFRPATLPYRCRGCGTPCGPPAAGHSCVKCGSDEAFCPWLVWNEGIAPKLARVIYDERAFDRMPILGDALFEAGCTDETILWHCRGWERCPYWIDKPVNAPEWHARDCELCHGKTTIPLRGPHARGCWVLSLLLGQD